MAVGCPASGLSETEPDHPLLASSRVRNPRQPVSCQRNGSWMDIQRPLALPEAFGFFSSGKAYSAAFAAFAPAVRAVFMMMVRQLPV